MTTLKNEFTIKIKSAFPPQLRIGDVVAGGEVIGLESANDDEYFVSARWLAEKLSLSKSTVTRKCASINVGTAGKGLYNKEQAITLLTNDGKVRQGRPRKN